MASVIIACSKFFSLKSFSSKIDIFLKKILKSNFFANSISSKLISKYFLDINAFQETKSKVDLQDVTLLLLIKQRQMDRDAELETSARNKIQAEINKMNEPIELDNSNEQPTKKLKRDQVLDDLDFSLDELTDEVEEEDELSDTLNGSSEDNGDFEDEAAELAYIPCSCHNVQLIIGDGIKDLDEKYQALLSKCTKDIVGKSKMSSIIADELRKIDIKLCQKCETRWNTILFVARSCLKPNPEQYKLILYPFVCF
jgi:hypothetical protein